MLAAGGRPKQTFTEGEVAIQAEGARSKHVFVGMGLGNRENIDEMAGNARGVVVEKGKQAVELVRKEGVANQHSDELCASEDAEEAAKVAKASKKKGGKGKGKKKDDPPLSQDVHMTEADTLPGGAAKGEGRWV